MIGIEERTTPTTQNRIMTPPRALRSFLPPCRAACFRRLSGSLETEDASERVTTRERKPADREALGASGSAGVGCVTDRAAAGLPAVGALLGLLARVEVEVAVVDEAEAVGEAERVAD